MGQFWLADEVEVSDGAVRQAPAILFCTVSPESLASDSTRGDLRAYLLMQVSAAAVSETERRAVPHSGSPPFVPGGRVRLAAAGPSALGYLPARPRQGSHPEGPRRAPRGSGGGRSTAGTRARPGVSGTPSSTKRERVLVIGVPVPWDDRSPGRELRRSGRSLRVQSQFWRSRCSWRMV